MADTRIITTTDGSNSLYSERYQQSFHSDKGAVTESKHIFLAQTGVAKRLARDSGTHVLEVGFGTGLNFFLTADVARGATLYYTALEQDLLTAEVVKQLEYQNLLENTNILSNYLTWCEALDEHPKVGTYTFSNESVNLELLLGEATEQQLKANHYHAIYMDAFSPDANSELWSETFLEKLYNALAPEGILSTYCVKGEVRRRMTALGFKIQKRPGPIGGKREILIAAKDESLIKQN